MKYVDSHSHWNQFGDQGLEERLGRCLEKGIDFFLQGGINPAEWNLQLELNKKYPQHFGLSFGLHPYFVSENAIEACEAALDQLANYLPKAMALGEAGLGFLS